MSTQPNAGVDVGNVTEAVARSFAASDNRRLAALLPALVRHFHAFVREERVTQAEWSAAMQFLTDCAAITTRERNEFILLSDILGVSSLVDLLGHSPGATPGSVLGPFHNHDSHWRENGVDLAAGQPGEPTVLLGQVSDTRGRGIANAEIDFWQNAANGFYPAQDPAQDPHNLRFKLRCDENGRFRINTVRPQPYTVPYDGPVGAMLTAAKRHCWRPAHFHVIVSAPGHAAIVTEIFPDDSPYVDSDAVFGVRKDLVAPFVRTDDPAMAAEFGVKAPFTLVRFNFRLAPAPGAMR
jgi:protocatechuate 3,4-dioxygenase beta subunit